MKRGIVYIILISVFFQTLANFIVHVEFLINEDYIAKNLCENRDKPQMKCNGQCHLKKQLKQTEKQEKKEINKRFEVPAFFAHIDIKVELKRYFKEKKEKPHTQIDGQLSSFQSTIFHPPQA